jgi:hypothetical protein
MRRATDDKLKLGKGAVFVKSRLRYLPQTDDIWEAGFRQLPKRRGRTEWFGVIVSVTDNFLLADLFVESTPSVNDLAQILADAMRRPLVEGPHRPQAIRLQAVPERSELIPHLEQLEIEVVTQDDLPKLEEVFSAFRREVIGHE